MFLEDNITHSGFAICPTGDFKTEIQTGLVLHYRAVVIANALTYKLKIDLNMIIVILNVCMHALL